MFKSYQKNYSFEVVGISEVEEPTTSEYFDEQYKKKSLLTKIGKKEFNKKVFNQLF